MAWTVEGGRNPAGGSCECGGKHSSNRRRPSGRRRGTGGCCRENGRGARESHERQVEATVFGQWMKQALSGDGEGEGKPM